MLGLGIAVLIFAVKVLAWGVAAPVALASVLSFLWYWYISWFVIGLFLAAGLGAIFGGYTANESGAGTAGTTAFTALGGLGAFMLILFTSVVPMALALGGVYIMYYAVVGHADFSTVPMENMTIGGIMYGIAVLMGVARRNQSYDFNKK